MAKEAIEKQRGLTIDYTLTKDVKSGDVIVLEEMIGIAAVSGLVGEKIAVEIEKVWIIKANSSDSIKVGQKVYFDDKNKQLTSVSTNNTYAGRAMSAKTATAGTIDVKINIP